MAAFTQDMEVRIAADAMAYGSCDASGNPRLAVGIDGRGKVGKVSGLWRYGNYFVNTPDGKSWVVAPEYLTPVEPQSDKRPATAADYRDMSELMAAREFFQRRLAFHEKGLEEARLRISVTEESIAKMKKEVDL